VGVDEDGDVIDSCVVVESSMPMPDAQRKRRGPNQVTGLEVLSDEVPVHCPVCAIFYKLGWVT